MGMAHNGPFSPGCFQKHGTLSLHGEASATLGTGSITWTHRIIKENTSSKQDARKIQLFPPCPRGTVAPQYLQRIGSRARRVCVCVCVYTHIHICMVFPGGSVVKNLPTMQET